MSVSSEIIVKAFIKMMNKNFLDAYLVKKGDNKSGEIFLKVSNLLGYAMLYSYRKSNINNPWEIYGSESWQIDTDINKKLDKITSIDSDAWIIELEDKNGKFSNFKEEV
ncbi:MAG: DUF1491 family protein [Alphaproteobacteria bacterium]|nr:DUF1491 family protein [Alphaproteobacteria bacterium]